jgi:3-mercaptopyruvate sulfurtransferase SseA
MAACILRFRLPPRNSQACNRCFARGSIEWRQTLARRGELPNDKPILVYCNTGSLPAQAGLALRVVGTQNVRILQGGFAEWKAKGGFDPYRRATESGRK